MAWKTPDAELKVGYCQPRRTQASAPAVKSRHDGAVRRASPKRKIAPVPKLAGFGWKMAVTTFQAACS
jgi:hypothetical protein